MIRVVRYLIGLGIALLFHFVGSQLWADFPRGVDLFLVATTFFALGASPAGGLAAGLVAGLLTDAVTGGLYGLHGLANTVVGYAVAFAAQRIVIQRAASAFVLFALAAATQRLILVGLTVALLERPQLPSYLWLLVQAGTAGILGVLLFAARKQAGRRMEGWRRSRTSKVRL